MPTPKLLIAFSTALFIFGVAPAQAQEAPAAEEKRWSHESELAIVSVDGNTESESYSGKQTTTYKWDANSLQAKGRYLQTKTAGIETAKSWEASLRYERALSDLWSIYAGQGAESDKYSGYIQRNNTDLGGKYIIRKNEKTEWFAELGYRHTTIRTTALTTESTDYVRIYTEYSQQLTEAVKFKFWVEHLPNLEKSEEYLTNAEPSLTVMLSEIFSLKSAYLVKYQNTVPAGAERADTTFTTSLVAKF